VQVTPVNARIALLDVNPQLQVRGFLYTIDLHLNGVIQSPGATPDQRSFASQIDTAIKNVDVWLANVRKDAQQLEPLSLQQLLQPAALAILNDMANQALYAFAGFFCAGRPGRRAEASSRPYCPLRSLLRG